MIITETLTINNKEFTHNYSDAGRYVVRDGISYQEAYDPAYLNRTYEEGDLIPVKKPREKRLPRRDKTTKEV